MTRWFAIDRDGFVAVFESGEAGAVPHAVAAPEAGMELTIAISRELRREHLPVRGVHANMRAGTVLMLGDTADVRRFAHKIEQVMVGALLAYFPPAPRGRPASFMPSVRTFGDGPDAPSALELLHMQRLCRGCIRDRADDHLDAERLAGLGFYVYVCDSTSVAEPYHRALVPESPLHGARLGRHTRRFAKFPGVFAAQDSVQPIEHWKKVRVDAPAWLGSDGTVRCVRGRATDYAKEYTLLLDEYANVEPPR